MSSEWVPFTKLLTKIVDNRGKTCPVGDAGIPLIATNCITNGALYPTYNTTRFVAQDTYDTWFRGHPEPGDILFVCKGSPGRTNWVRDPVDFCIAQDMVAVRANSERIYPKYLFAALRSSDVLAQIDNMHVGTMIPHFKKGDFDKLKIPVPTRAEQEFIGDFYFTFSERIEHLRETNATLEAIAQALFKSWFVDFDPVRAKQEGRSPEGMDEATAALFPDGFEESELGLVPRGWRFAQFGQLLSHTIGGDWGAETPDDKNDTQVAIVRGTDIPDLRAGGKNRVPIRFTPSKKLLTRKLQHGDIVLEVSGGSKDQPTGRALYVTDSLLGQFNCPVEPASFCRLLRPNTEDLGVLLGQHLSYIYELGKTWEYQNQSTGIANFQTTHFLETELVAVPSDNVLSEFSSIVRPLIGRSHLSQIQRLAELRDTLLPRLISGQLRLPETRAQLEGVLP
ncbi:MAG: restriction endonuclease subunit S [Azoarcus sp. PHD]|nr:MAG: restriction endonuclease subunit S [Azoarcus sp. PHD]